METRNILIANTKTQQRSTLQSSATTLAELKAEMTAAGIDYADMTFTEGFSKTQLLSDDSLLPTNVTYRGQTTNDLLILLTNTTKKIASGAAENRSRSDAYARIAELGENIKDAIKDYFNRNYTQVTTDALWRFIDDWEDTEDEEEDEEDTDTNEEETEEEAVLEETLQDVNSALKDTLATLQSVLEEVDKAHATVASCISQISSLVPKTYQLGGVQISDDEINNMIAGI